MDEHIEGIPYLVWWGTFTQRKSPQKIIVFSPGT